MATIHLPGDGHTAPAPVGGYQFLPYTDVDALRTIRCAVALLNAKSKGLEPCNKCFKRMPNGKTFDELLADPDLFLHYDPQNIENQFAGTLRGTKNITITAWALGKGVGTVAATLVHEFGHVNGVHGPNHDAERPLLYCGFADLHNPSIIGTLESKRGTGLA